MKPDPKLKTSPASSTSQGSRPAAIAPAGDPNAKPQSIRAGAAAHTEDTLEDHWLVEPTPERIIWCRRQNRAYTTPEQAHAILVMLNARLDPFPRSQWAIVLDARDGPIPKSDPAIEEVIVNRRKELFRGFAGAAVLVLTATGAMQISREAKQDGSSYGVFSDEAAARAYIAARLTNRRRGTFGG